MRSIRNIIIFAGLTLAFSASALAQATGSIGGQVIDGLGAVVVGATVSATSSTGVKKEGVTNARGEYAIPALAAGTYTVRVSAAKFAPYENPEVVVVAGERNELIVAITVGGVEENVDINVDNTLSTDAENNASATVIKGKDLDALPDDPDELEAALQALAGPAAGPNGGQIYIDGFTGGRLPPKDSIREIRVNQNPFSAEYDRLGFGRIEILTKPGTDKFRGQVFGNFNDESLNSRNPFALNRAPSQTRFFGGNISGPIQKGKSSYFLDISNRDVDNNTIVNALILDPAFNVVSFRQDYQVPTRRFSIGPRIDYAINDKNTLVARYSFDRSSNENQGIGDTSLLSRAYNTKTFGHELRLTETMIINPTTVNETRFEYNFNKREQNGDNSIPTINVSSAFTGGGAQIGNSFNSNRTIEINNFTTTTWGKTSQHTLKFGGRLRNVSIDDRSENNYGGSFSFPGSPAVTSPSGCTIGSPGCVVVTPAISPLDQYRGKLLGTPGVQYNPTQFTLTTGDPLAGVNQTDYGVFVTDDWRFSPGLLLSFGLRYENQTNISSKFNFAPRFGFAYSPGAGGAKAPKTVFRGGAGIFYDRFGENFTLQADRFDGVKQLNLLVSANETDLVRRAAALTLLAQPVFTLNGVANVPTAAQIQAVLPGFSTTRLVADDLSSPYIVQGALGVERQLPAKTTLSAFFITSRGYDQLRSRNINAPVCAAITNCVGAIRPDPTKGNIQQYESTGRNVQNQLNIGFRNNFSQRISFFGNYTLSSIKSDTDGAGSSPAYSYDLTGEFGRASFDVRHRFIIGGNVTLPWSISLNPFITANSGRPFNITRGFDANGDGYSTERPTFGELGSRCSALGLTYTWCDVSGQDPNGIIPRNYAVGPSSFTVNLRVGKNFGFGKALGGGNAAGGGNGGGGGRRGGGGGAGPQVVAGPGGGGGGPRGGGGGGFFGGGGEVRRPYNLNLSINFSNLLNNVNFNPPVSSLTSSRFGQYTSTGGGFGGFGGFGGGAANRRIELQTRFSW